MTGFAGALINAALVNNYLAPSYQYTSNGTSTAVGTPTTTFNDYTGQLTVDIDVTDTGILMVGWGFEGYNNNTASSSVRLGIDISGANTQTASTNLSAAAANSGAGNGGAFHTSRWHIYTGLNSGTTTVTTKGYISSGSSSTNFVDNQWLFVGVFY